MKKREEVTATCLVCQRIYHPVSKTQKYCSSDCCRKNQSFYLLRKEFRKNCIVCKNDFFTHKKKQKYCSNECKVKADKAFRLIYHQTHSSPFFKMRFQVFERDNFKCRYCGHGVEDGVKLVIDHILPKAKNGQNELSNYITACTDCNTGKADALLLAAKDDKMYGKR